MLAEIGLAVHHLHKHSFVHRDLKIENIMVGQDGHLKIIDLGLCRRLALNEPYVLESKRAGSIMYMPRELLLHGQVGYFTDWWAFGVLAHELMTGCSPWSTLDDRQELFRQITSLRVPPPPSLSYPAANLIFRLMDHAIVQRLGSSGDFDEVQKHAFFNNQDWESISSGKADPPMHPRQVPIDLSNEYEHQNLPGVDWNLGLPMSNTKPAVSPITDIFS